MSISDLEPVFYTGPIDFKTNKPVFRVYLKRGSDIVGEVDADEYAEFDQYRTNIEPPIRLVDSQFHIEKVDDEEALANRK